MEAVERPPVRLPLVGELRFDPAGFATWLVSALLIVYLALNNGGYDVTERSEVGIAVWWAVLVGTLIGVLPVAGGTRTGRIMFGLLAAFAGWTALSLTWTESAERTSIELARVATYLGVFALALGAQGKGRWRHLLNGITTGVGFICLIAVLSRLEPTWFPDNFTGRFVSGIEIERRLAYPINYSSGLGALAAISVPLLLAATASARSHLVQALAAAAIPVAALTLWLTSSGLSVLAIVVALAAFFLLAPDRLPKLATLAISAAGSAILFAAVEQRDALNRGLPTPEALQQGGELEVILAVVCVGVALAHTGVGLATRYGRKPAWMEPTRSQVSVTAAIVAISLLAIGLASGLGGKVVDRFDEFKDQGGGAEVSDSRADQLLSLSGSGRYQFWESAVDAGKEDLLTGTGPGTFEFWWAQHGSYAGFTRDAHSLYLESFAELGIVGMLLIMGFSIAVLVIGAIRVLSAPPELRLAIAAAAAGCAAFVAAAVVDWVWEIGALAVVFMALAAIVIGAGRAQDLRPEWYEPIWRRWLAPATMVVLALASLVAIAMPLAGSTEIARSRSAAAQGNVDAALTDARDAASVQSYAATPYVQEALLLEQEGLIPAATASAREATENEPTNWRNWLVLSRLEAEGGDAAGALRAYREARSLNPKSGIFAQ